MLKQHFSNIILFDMSIQLNVDLFIFMGNIIYSDLRYCHYSNL